MGKALLGADRGHGLGFGVQLDSKVSPIAVADGSPQIGNAPRGGVPVVLALAGRFDDLVHHEGGRGNVRVAEAQIHHILPGPAGGCLGLIYLGENIRGQILDTPEIHRSQVNEVPRWDERPDD